MKEYGGYKIVFTLYNSPSVISIVEQPNETNKVQTAGIKDPVNGKQFVIHGKWKPGKRAQPNVQLPTLRLISYVLKRCLNYHFKFHEDRLNKINAVEELRKILKTIKILLIGDSLMTDFYLGLAELLQVKVKDPKYHCGMNFTLHPGINTTLTHIKACLILLKGHETFAKWDKTRVNSRREHQASHC